MQLNYKGREQKNYRNNWKTNNNGNKYIPTNNYFKCKWTKRSNQKAQGGWMDKRARPIYKRLTSDLRYMQTESEGMEKHLPCKWKQKESWVSILMSNKIDFIFISLLIYFESERVQEYEQGRGRVRGRENPKQAPWCQRRARCRAWSHELWDHDLSWDQELATQPSEPPRCPKT